MTDLYNGTFVKNAKAIASELNRLEQENLALHAKVATLDEALETTRREAEYLLGVASPNGLEIVSRMLERYSYQLQGIRGR